MAITIEDVQQFAAYATARISNGGADLTWQELFEMWMLENPPTDEREEVNSITARRRPLATQRSNRFARDQERQNFERRRIRPTVSRLLTPEA